MSSWSATASITRRPTAIFPTWACSSARSTRPEMADNTKSTKKRGPFRGVAIWIIVALLLGLAAFSLFGRDGFEQIDTEQGLELLESGQVEQAKIIDGNQQRVDLVLSEDFVDGDQNKGTEVRFSYVTARGSAVVDAVEEADPADGYTDEIASSSWWSTLLLSFLPILILIGLFWFLIMNAQGGGRAMQFGKSKAKLFNKEAPKVTFSDVAGAEEAVEELDEIKQFLVEPGRYQAVGAKIPKGVLLYGPPGTGKTLLARAVAGEASVPFYSISGSDFVEMFVGVGASRVRDLFNTAKENSPAIIFIDEIDAVGRHRGAGMGGGHDEREQTLNQLLVEMDGFGTNEGIIVMAATNRPDILDPALLRPGRFDRQIYVGLPDIRGREEILKVHTKNKPLASDVDLKVVARRTPGFTPADLENLVNEAALLSARYNHKEIPMHLIEEASIKVQAGPEKKSRVVSEKERRLTAYHEAGHALTARLIPGMDPVHMVTIIPRGMAGGFTAYIPEEDVNYRTKSEMEDRLVTLLGGRVSEALVLGDISTGAQN